MVNNLGASRIGVWLIKHFLSPFQRWIYKSSGGKVLSSIGSDRAVLLLTTKGRRTGKERTIPVFYVRHGDAVAICNVRPRNERTNPWVINLRTHPLAQLQIGGDVSEYIAREATDKETTHLWPRLVELWPAFRVHYEYGGRRTIFILERE